MSNDIHEHDEEQDEHEYKWRLADDSVETNIHEAEEEEDGQISECKRGWSFRVFCLIIMNNSIVDY